MARRKAYTDANLYVADVESIALRNDGDETQPALAIKTRTGFLIVRCIGRPGTVPRFSDLRGADRKRKKKRANERVFIDGQEARAALVPLKKIEEHPTRSLRARDYVPPRSSEEAEHQACAAEAAEDARQDR